MDIKDLVRRTYNHTIAVAPIHPELKRSMKDHPTTKGFVQRLYGQIISVEGIRRKQGKKALKPETIKATVRDFTLNLIAQINFEADKRIRSDLEKLRIERENQRKQDLELASKGKFTGEFEELKDILISDERSV